MKYHHCSSSPTSHRSQLPISVGGGNIVDRACCNHNHHGTSTTSQRSNTLPKSSTLLLIDDRASPGNINCKNIGCSLSANVGHQNCFSSGVTSGRNNQIGNRSATMSNPAQLQQCDPFGSSCSLCPGCRYNSNFNNNNNNSLDGSKCRLSLIALSLVFILIWSMVLSSILIIRSFKEQESSADMIELSTLHKDLGQLIFTIGNEMIVGLKLYHDFKKASFVFPNQTINIESLESDGTPIDFNSTDDKSFLKENLKQYRIKQNNTDLLMQQVIETLNSKGFNFSTILHEKLSRFRYKCYTQFLESASMVDCVKTFEKDFYSLDSILIRDNQWLNERHSKFVLTDLSLRDMPFSLLVRGIVHRFTALGLGFILAINNLQYKTSNISEYFHYFYSSRQQIESSFLWNSRFHQKYIELEQAEYQTELLVQHFNRRLLQEQESCNQMNRIFSKLFNEDSLDRIQTYIKKKNAESIERIMENGTGTKYVADQEANQVNIQVDSEFLESFGLQKLEAIRINNEASSTNNISKQYEEIMKNQIQFLIRTQDFLNVSIYSHLIQSTMNEETNFIYHIAVIAVLLISVLFCMIMFICTYLCYRQKYSCPLTGSTSKKPWINRRMFRRRFWKLSSPTSKVKKYFSSSMMNHSHQTASHHHLSTSRNPSHCMKYHYQSNNHHCHHGHQRFINHHCSCTSSNFIVPCSSPSSGGYLVSSSSKRTFAGGIINRYFATPIGKNASNSNKAKLFSCKFRNSRDSGQNKSPCSKTTMRNDDGFSCQHCSSNGCTFACNTNNNNNPVSIYIEGDTDATTAIINDKSDKCCTECIYTQPPSSSSSRISSPAIKTKSEETNNNDDNKSPKNPKHKKLSHSTKNNDKNQQKETNDDNLKQLEPEKQSTDLPQTKTIANKKIGTI